MIGIYELLWLTCFPFTLLSWLWIARHRRRYIARPPARPSSNPVRLIFLIACRRTNPCVQRAVDSVHSSCREAGLRNYEVKVVADEAVYPITGAGIIQVPESYTCNARFKARALNCALEHLPDSRDVWILHLDEDSVVTPQAVLSVAGHIEGGGAPLANGPLSFPLNLRNPLTLYMEAQRFWTHYWLVDQMVRSRPHWMNGSNMLVRSDVEHAIGWEFGLGYGEDSRFALEAERRFGRVFGWHGGLVLEEAPASVASAIRQRRRWIAGSLLNLRHVPPSRRALHALSVVSWADGFFLSLLFFIAVAGLYRPADWFLSVASVEVFLWMGRHQLGLYQILRFTDLGLLRKALLHLGLLVLTPVIELLCTLPAVYGLLRPPREFEVTEKLGLRTVLRVPSPQGS